MLSKIFTFKHLNINAMTNSLHKEKLLILRFKNKIQQRELPLLRGAIIQLLKEKNDVLFHNHEGDKFRYSYPLIQYKRINQCASLVCINEGTEAIGLLLMQHDLNCVIGEQPVQLEIDQVKANQFLIQTWQSDFSYYLRKWLPLNQDNYAEFQKLEGIAEKCFFLEKILIGNILSMGKGIGVHFENEVRCKITQISNENIVRYKGVQMISFDIEFKTNVSLPDYIGLGKSASIGFGMVAGKREKKENQ
jgi:hypothetical protein